MRLTRDMQAVVVGLGKSGIAAVRYLSHQGLSVKVSEYRQQDELGPDEMQVVEQYCLDLETGGHSQEFFASADLVVVSPGVPLDLPVLQDAGARSVPVVGELALAAGRVSVPVIAVTGSNGKTTVTSLIGHLLRTAGKKVFVGGNIGTPFLEYLLAPDDADLVVLELSSFQLQRAGKFRPDIGLLLNISADHLDWHGSMAAYVTAKKQLFRFQLPTDSAIVGNDDTMARDITTRATVTTFGSGSACRARVSAHGVLVQPGFGSSGRPEEYDLNHTLLQSRVNMYNAAAAVLAARSYGCCQEDIKQGLASYQPPEHRMTPVADIKGVAFVNDSKATNVGAVNAALSGFSAPVVLIAGGREKGSDFSQLKDVVNRHVRHLMLIGEAADALAAALGPVVPTERATDMCEAVTLALAAAEPGDTVLLAPACASFDMFADYGERGRVFCRCVEELKIRVEA